jgi:hypothetical protein
MALVKIFSGSEITAQAIKTRLNEYNIGTVIKNHIQSGTVAGFGTLGLSVEIYVEQEDVVAAKQVVEEFMNK